MLPVRLIVEVVAGIVRVDVDDDTLKGLPEFEPGRLGRASAWPSF